MRLVDGVDEIDLEGAIEDVEVDSDNVALYIDGEDSTYDALEGDEKALPGSLERLGTLDCDADTVLLLRLICDILVVKSINSRV